MLNGNDHDEYTVKSTTDVCKQVNIKLKQRQMPFKMHISPYVLVKS